MLLSWLLQSGPRIYLFHKKLFLWEVKWYCTHSPWLAHFLGPKSALVTKVYENAYEKDFLDYTIVKIAWAKYFWTILRIAYNWNQQLPRAQGSLKSRRPKNAIPLSKTLYILFMVNFSVFETLVATTSVNFEMVVYSFKEMSVNIQFWKKTNLTVFS